MAAHSLCADAASARRRSGQSLLDLGLSVERPLAILSDNSLEHLTLAMGALWAGVPFVPVSPAYSLLSKDHAKLKHILGTVTPGLVFASDATYGDCDRRGRARRHAGGAGAWRPRRSSGAPLRRSARARRRAPTLAAAHAQVGPDTIAKFLFTSGSTKAPKGVINTHRMWCANQQMLRQCMRFLAEEPPVLVDWLPWNHTFGGNHNVGITLVNGGTLYIDDGKPTPAGMAETLRNLREISPTVYFNVPKGFEEIARAMDHDALLRTTLFARCKAFMFAGAALSQAVWDQLDAHGAATIGERLRIITGLGMTETAPSCTFAVGTDNQSGHIGLPVPGCRGEAGARGRQDRDPLSRAQRDAGLLARARADARGVRRRRASTAPATPCAGSTRPDPQRGLLFDGRTAEDFKLSTGTFVSVGPLRARIIEAGDPCVQDAVITGLNRDTVGALIFPRLDACRRIAGCGERTPAPEVLHQPAVRAHFQAMLDHAGGAGHRQRQPARAHPRAGRAAVDRQGRAHRQELDQSTRGAAAPCVAGRGVVRRAARPIRSSSKRGRDEQEVVHRVQVQFGDCELRHRHVIERGDDVLCEGTEVRTFAIRDPENPERIRSIPIPEDIKAPCL